MSDRTDVGIGSPVLPLTDCWNGIGVRGDGSCGELKKHVHCRNCPVYSRTAIDLLDIESPDGYVAGCTTHLATSQQAVEGHTESLFIFRIGPEWFALPTSMVKEVTGARPIHSLPHRNGGVVLGLANVRGELVVCVSLLRVLDLGEDVEPNRRTERTGRQRLLVIRHDRAEIVCRVDEVHGIHGVASAEIQDVPTTVARAAASYSKAVVSWHSRSVALLDPPRLFAALRRSLS